MKVKIVDFMWVVTQFLVCVVRLVLICLQVQCLPKLEMNNIKKSVEGISLTLSCIKMKNGKAYFKNLVAFTLQDFKSMFGHFSTLCAKGFTLFVPMFSFVFQLFLIV